MANNNSESEDKQAALSETKIILSEDEAVSVPMKVSKEDHVHHGIILVLNGLNMCSLDC